jgi:hypothetical protein
MRKLYFVFFINLLITKLIAGSTLYFENTTYEDFFGGEQENVAISSDGSIIVTNEIKKISLNLDTILSTYMESKDKIFIGTGRKAEIFVVSNQKAKKIFSSDDIGITAFAKIDKTIFAASIPSGKIYKIDKDGSVTFFTKLPAQYIWELSVCNGELYAATGDPGKLFKIDQNGKFKEIFSVNDSHIYSLFTDNENTIYFGTSPKSLLYKKSLKDKPILLYDFESSEVASIYKFKDKLYVGVNNLGEKGEKKDKGAKVEPESKEEVLDIKEFSIYEFTQDKFMRQIFSTNKELVYDIKIDSNENIYVASGNNGRVYKIERNQNNYYTLFSLDDLEIKRIILSNNEPFLLVTTSMGNIYTINNKNKGSYISKILDTDFLSDFGNITWESRGEITVQTRSSNSQRIDSNWSEWSIPYKNPNKITSPSGRFIQYKVNFLASDAKLNSLNLAFLNYNQKPKISSIKIEKDKTIEGQNREELEENIIENVDRKKRFFDDSSAVVRIFWKADDPDHDRLICSLFFKEENETNWKPIKYAENLEITSFAWDTNSIPNGIYEIKIVCSDQKDNTKERMLFDYKISNPFLIDNSLPIIKDIIFTQNFVTGFVQDDFSIIRKIEYSLDGLDWQLIFPVDNIFDDKIEKFKFTLADISHDSHSISIRAFDLDNNIGVGKIIIKNP